MKNMSLKHKVIFIMFALNVIIFLILGVLAAFDLLKNPWIVLPISIFSIVSIAIPVRLKKINEELALTIVNAFAITNLVIMVLTLMGLVISDFQDLLFLMFPIGYSLFALAAIYTYIKEK